MRVLITGGCGYIGGRLSEYLLFNGYEVVIATRKKYECFTNPLNLSFRHISWDRICDLKEVCKNIDVIIHAAGMNADDCLESPVKAINFNGHATARLVDAAFSSGVKRIIYLSTAHVYLSPLSGEIKEGDPLRNMHPYATSHVAGERAVLSASKLGSMDGIVLRISNAVGRPHHKGVNCWKLLIPNLCKQAVLEKKMEIYNNPNQKRDFIAIGEVCRIIKGIIESDCEFGGGSIFNLGSGVSKTLLEVAYEVRSSCEKILGYSPIVSSAITKEDKQELSFHVDQVQESFGKICPSITTEIDGLIEFCQQSYIHER